MDVWKAIEPLLLNSEIGAPATIVFGRLYELCGCQPGQLTITTKAVSKLFARDRSSILAQFKKLHQIHDLAYMRQRSKGVFQFDIYRPNAGHETALPDPQRELPGFSDDATMDLPAMGEEGFVFVPTAEKSGLHASEESQRSGATGEPQRLASRGAAPFGSRGEIPTGTADPRGNPHGPESSGGNSHDQRGEIPMGKSHDGRGEIPTGQNPSEKRPFSAPNRNVGKSPEERGEIPPRLACAPASLDPLGSNEPNGSNDSNEPNVPIGDARGSLAAGPPRGEIPPADRETQLLERYAAARRAEIARKEPEPPAAGAGVAEAIATAVDERFGWGAQKTRLVTELQFLVADPDTAEWLFGYAADVMIVHGQSTRPDAGLIFARFEQLRAELKEFREAQDRDGRAWTPRGQVFNKRVMAIVRDFQIPLPRELKAARIAESRRARAKVPT